MFLLWCVEEFGVFQKRFHVGKFVHLSYKELLHPHSSAYNNFIERSFSLLEHLNT
jgi:hypothetical protein